MQGKISTDTVRAALNLSQTHPQAKPLDVLDLVIRGRTGSLAVLGSLHPTSPFGQPLAGAFDPAMDPRDWAWIDHPNAEPAAGALLRSIWLDQVVTKFAVRQSFEPSASNVPSLDAQW
jgi:hypothetical protein